MMCAVPAKVSDPTVLSGAPTMIWRPSVVVEILFPNLALLITPAGAEIVAV